MFRRTNTGHSSPSLFGFAEYLERIRKRTPKGISNEKLAPRPGETSMMISEVFVIRIRVLCYVERAVLDLADLQVS